MVCELYLNFIRASLPYKRYLSGLLLYSMEAWLKCHFLNENFNHPANLLALLIPASCCII